MTDVATGQPTYTHAELRAFISEALLDVARASDTRIEEPLNDDMVLLESGLDSLGFAILVARLEEDLGWDPFTLSDQPFYPTLLGEFIAFYEANQP